MTFSPWHGETAELASPDGAITATVENPMELGMGGPSMGELVLSNGMRREGCSPSMVWSPDSEYLAIAQWGEDHGQRLMILSMSRRQSRYAGRTYRVIELESFDGRIVTFVDSPKSAPVRIELDVSKLEW